MISANSSPKPSLKANRFYLGDDIQGGFSPSSRNFDSRCERTTRVNKNQNAFLVRRRHRHSAINKRDGTSSGKKDIPLSTSFLVTLQKGRYIVKSILRFFPLLFSLFLFCPPFLGDPKFHGQRDGPAISTLLDSLRLETSSRQERRGGR